MAQILDAALELFNERGVGAVSTRAIAERAGISSGNLHYHFQNKQAVVRALLESRNHATNPLWAAPQDVTSLRGFERLLQRNLELAWQYRFLYRELAPIAIRDLQFRELYVSAYQQRMQELRVVLESLVNAGALDLTAEQLDVALTTGWIVSQSWVVHLEALGVEVDPEPLADGARLVLSVVTASATQSKHSSSRIGTRGVRSDAAAPARPEERRTGIMNSTPTKDGTGTTSTATQGEAPLRGQDLGGPVPKEVDVVIVGAGTAGSVLAARLSEDPACRVLLVEAGTTTGTEPAARVPGMAFSLMSGATVWPDLTVPQHALGGRQVYLAQGRGLGGGSAMNAMAWFHGHPADYDGWQQAGAKGWAWSDVQPVLRALEDSEFGPDPWHGIDGPMTVTGIRDVSALPLKFIAAGREFGWPVTTDFNGRIREGVGLYSNNIRDGQRHSVVDGYLTPAADRSNLHIRTGLQATAVDIQGRRARAVTYTRDDGTMGQVTATRGIVLTAGALRTPQLLMLSGVGPAAQLGAHGIPVVRDLPGVGANLQDHPLLTPVWPVTDHSPLQNAVTPDDQRAYELVRRGPLASLSQAGAVVRTDPGEAGPDIQITLTLLGLDVTMQPITDPVVTAAVSLLSPRSRGTVTLASADPHAAPVADPAYLTHPADRDRLKAGLRTVQRLFETGALAAATGQPIQPADWTDDALDDWITGNAGTEWHPAGTCRMGTDPHAVTDPVTMVVHGVQQLYVADSSVMPTVTRGNLQAPVLMIAERAADRIRAALIE